LSKAENGTSTACNAGIDPNRGEVIWFVRRFVYNGRHLKYITYENPWVVRSGNGPSFGETLAEYHKKLENLYTIPITRYLAINHVPIKIKPFEDIICWSIKEPVEVVAYEPTRNKFKRDKFVPIDKNSYRNNEDERCVDILSLMDSNLNRLLFVRDANYFTQNSIGIIVRIFHRQRGGGYKVD